jgi:hypothetical protein
MRDYTYPWKRFWFPVGAQVHLDSDGFLLDPDSGLGFYLNRNLTTLDRLTTQRCLILLGEGGMGKSWEMDESVGQASADMTGPHPPIYLQLERYSELQLDKKLFENAAIRNWEGGSGNLHLYLDSFDECRLNVRRAVERFLEWLRPDTAGRLSLRIACRPAEWPDTLDRHLRELYGTGFSTHLLAPLRRRDVLQAAETRGIPGERFLEQIQERGLAALAIKPGTLEFLLDLFGPSEGFPPDMDQWELYYRGCLRLCEEPSRSRKDAGYLGSLEPSERLEIAARIAAITLFSDRPAVRTDASVALPLQPGQVSAVELADTPSRVRRGEKEITAAAVCETTKFPLFSGWGEGLALWAQWPHAEFLAAYYVWRQNVPADKLRALLLHPAQEASGATIPQLRGTAAWLSVKYPELFEHLLQFEPEALLASDAVIASPERRSRLALRLLDLCEQGNVPAYLVHHPSCLGDLNHPGLADQLRPYLADRTRPRLAREVAIELARACGKVELAQTLADVALDDAEELNIRATAASAVVDIGDLPARKRLLPLLTDSPDDPEGRLKMNALRTVWPDVISLDALLPSLEYPDGSYPERVGEFLVSVFARSVRPEDLPRVLLWLRTVHRESGYGHYLILLGDRLLESAAERFPAADVLDAAARLAARRIGHGRGLPGRRARLDRDEESIPDVPRRLLVERIVEIADEEDLDIGSLTITNPPVLGKADLGWMLERLERSELAEVRKRWALLVKLRYDPQHQNQLSRVAEQFPEVKEILEPLLSETPAPAAAAPEPASTDQPPAQESPAVGVRVASLLDRCEQGEFGVWIDITRELAGGYQTAAYLKVDLTQSPSWNDLEGSLQQRALGAAAQYLQRQDPDQLVWSPSGVPAGAIAAVKALRLLLDAEPPRAEIDQSEIWTRWTPTLVTFPSVVLGDDHAEIQALRREAYQRVPQVWIDAFWSRLVEEDGVGWRVSVDVPDHFWDDLLSAELRRRLEEEVLGPHNSGLLLRKLVEHGDAPAQRYGEDLVARWAAGGDAERDRAVASAAGLLLAAEGGSWSVLRPLFSSDPEFGRAVVRKVLDYAGFAREALFGQLGPEGQAELYLWLRSEFRDSASTDSGNHAQPGPESEAERMLEARVGDCERALLKRLGDTPLWAAVSALEKIRQSYPEEWEVLQALGKSQEAARRGTWERLAPRQLLDYIQDERKRIVRTGEELLEVLIASLERLERRLAREETPAVIELWNEVSLTPRFVRGVLGRLVAEAREGSVLKQPCEAALAALPENPGRERLLYVSYTPKDENRLSDYVKRHLQSELVDQGIVVNREAEVERGAETDIKVDLVPMDQDAPATERLTAVVEVKGSWNRELYTALDSQLVDRYLVRTGTRFGVYLVGWFNCDAWDPSDYRKADAPRESMEAAEQRLDAQAQAASQDARLVRVFVMDCGYRTSQPRS